MRCKHCGNKLKYDPSADYVVYNGEIYCNEDCMLYDVDYGFANVEDVSEDTFNSEDYWSSCGCDNEMSIEEAMLTLICHNKWRRDSHIPNMYEMVNPTELGKAIEVAINSMEKLLDCKQG